MSRRFIAAVGAAVAVLGLVALPASATPAAEPPPVTAAAAAQTLTWTAGDSVSAYTSAPTTAVAGETTIVFENSEATGNTTGMSHTLTFDTSTPGYNHDVPVNILANPFDSNGGRHEATVNLTPGKYRYFCTIPGHSTMVGEFTVEGGTGDTTPPTVTATITGTQDADGNYVDQATVNLAATDNTGGSGVASTEYKLDTGAWTPYTAPVTVSAVGAHTVAYRATDVAGNVSQEGSKPFTVVDGGGGEDTTPPTVDATVTGTQDADGNYVESATVTVTATDNQGGSGVATTEYKLDDAAWAPYTQPVLVSVLGQHTVLYRATDGAGNVSTEGSKQFTVVADQTDTTPPTVDAEVSGTQDADGNYVDVATVSLSATDAESGVASVEYKVDEGAWTAYSTPVAVNTPGMHMVSYRATDVAGNVSPEGMAHFTVVQQDSTAPTVSGRVVGQQDENGAYIGSAMVTVTATDNDGGSGVASVEYQLDGGAWTAYTESVQVSDPGAHTVLFRATDQAGNTSPEGSVTFTVVAGEVDETPPSVSAVVSGTQNSSWQYLDAANITISALDTGSGVDSVEYKLDSGAWTGYTEPVVVNTAGTHTFYYRATDLAGNMSAELSGSFTVVESGPAPGPDVCPDSDVRDTVIIGDIDSQVANVDIGNGCTINDVIDEDGDWSNHNQFVRHVKAVTKELVQNGVITTAMRDRIVTAAVNSTVGMPTAARA
ncbi:OmpL47-type beta-barrel domain-containing protein [Actinophytocola sp. NPDC049390]|uniref:OmpL47-type beta-barrel domain-containing protein n=1 Tax=Actinophytocola sp. NPDC049390 TaxID=3363894 RepID=UPI00379F5B5C